MNYLEFITPLRNQSGDTRRRVHVDWIGDGSTTIFQMPTDTFPIFDQTGAYVVKVGGSIKTETTDFVLHKNEGTLVLNSAPTNGQEVTLDCSAVYLTDDDWLDIINAVIKSLGDDFWKEFVDSGNFVTTASMLSLDLSADRPNCIAVYEFQHRQNSSDEWMVVENFANWRYDRDNNVIYIGKTSAFSSSGELLRVRGLEGYSLGAATSDTLEVQGKFHTILEYGCLARYFRWRYKSVIELVSKMSSESSRTPLQELIMVSDRFDRLYEIEKAKLKPQKPSRVIPRSLQGGGRP